MKAGDVVYLLASGVSMTVESCDDASVECVWFGIDADADWTGPHRRIFRRDEITESLQHAHREQLRGLRDVAEATSQAAQLASGGPLIAVTAGKLPKKSKA